ncbi:aldehyde dehydrogenase [Caballeronia arationis]|jgi:phenylacetaldehyde dehydrogenase|uniref:Acyl-CoA reductase n=1 Tax=Caballeronia arationis TaxID=1777142 RepID=A0A7Z7IE75_9BURK|nr:aldehyde dehydrogenase family protein [Caballeronia arationis]SAK65846.1 aldehyde dehydrogenase [Caballeronia arationis]SOE89148.1 Acyl-CoA reductase [Caballeronia arationis]
MSTIYESLGARSASFIRGTHRLLIGGRWVDAQSGKTFDVFDPGTGEVVARVAESDAADIDLAVRAARRAFETGDWAKMKPADRTRVMFRLADLIEHHGDELAEIEAVDNGKPLAVAKRGIAGTAEMLRYMAGWATKLNGESVNVSVPGEWHAYTTREPVGVVGQIIPWNFPLSMAIWKIAPALATGCTVVLKPAEQTPLNALRLGQIIQEAGIPDGVVNVVTGFGATAGAALAAHPDVDKIAFTGSTETGKRIVQAALGNLKKVSLELGGKSPVFVFPDADLDLATTGAANAIFFNSGQVCSAGSRLFVHRKVFDRVIEGVIEHGDKLKVGHGLAPDSQIGPLISSQQMQRVSAYIRQGEEEGARRMNLKSAPDNGGYFVRPTVFIDTSTSMSIYREEIFGPVVCAMPFDDEDLEAIAAEANNSEFGLFAGIWTQNLSVAHKLARRIKAGSVSVNAHMVNEPALPFGGYKQSGWGRERGREVLDLYTSVKSIAINLD